MRNGISGFSDLITCDSASTPLNISNVNCCPTLSHELGEAIDIPMISKNNKFQTYQGRFCPMVAVLLK